MVWGIIAAIIAVATSAASYMQAKKAEKLAAKQAEEMAAVQISGHNNNRSLYTVYGKALLGSTVVWKKLSGKRAQLSLANFTVLSAATGNDLISQTTDTPKRYLYRAVTLCNGPVEAVTNVLVDGEGYQSTRFKMGHNRHFGAAISLGPTNGLYYSRLKNYSATDFSQWDNTKLGKGICYAMERLYLDKDNPAYQGEPSTQYLVKGRKLYDPRLDSTVTGGSGAHRSNNSATWAYSDNPVLALLDYVTNDEYGRGLAHTTIDLASIIVCANSCDVLVDIPDRETHTGETVTIWILGVPYTIPAEDYYPNYRPDQDTTTNKQKRYRINVAIDGSKEILDNIQQILNVFKGNFVYINGKYTVTMADVASPVLSITDDDIIGGLTIADGDRSQRMNRATVKFTNENKDYKTDQVSWPEIGTSEYNAYLAEDQNEKLHRTFTIDGCTDFYQAEDTAEFLVRDGRTGLTVSGTFGSRALALAPGDVIALTYDSASYSGKFFRVQTVALNIQTMNVNLTLREYDSSVYTWNANKGNEPVGFSWHEDPVNLSPTSPTIGTIATTTHTQGDSTAVIVMTVPFTGVPEDAHRVEISASVQNENNYVTVNVTDLPTETSAALTLGRGGVTYDVRVRYIIVDVNGTHLPSAYVRTTHAVPALVSDIGTKVGEITDGATRNTTHRQTNEPSALNNTTGDFWIDTDDSNKLYVWDGSAWVTAQDGNITTAISNAATAQAAADGKIDSFYQDDAPSTASEGDLWFDTNDGNKIYTRRSDAWVETQDSAIGTAIANAATAQATADGKVVTFYQNSAPTAEGTGDLWVDTSNGNKLYRWDGSAWVSIQDTSIAAAQAEAEKQYASFFRVTVTSGTSVAAPSDSAFTTQFGRAPVEHDVVVVTNTATTPDTQAAYVRGASAWGSAVPNFMSGDLIVDGSIGANHITVSSLAAINADMGTITAGSISSALITGDVTEVYPIGMYINNSMGTTGTTTYQDFYIPAPTQGISKRQKAEITMNFKLYNSGSTDRTVTFSAGLQMKSKSATGISIGTVTHVSYPFSYHQYVSLAGNVLGAIDNVGSVAKTNNAAGTYGAGFVRGALYDADDNKTYVLVSNFQTTFVTGDTMFFSVSNFDSVGTFSQVYLGTQRVYVPAGHTITSDVNVTQYFGSSSTFTNLRPFVSASTNMQNVTGTFSEFRGTMENIA